VSRKPKALDAGYDLSETKCNRCRRVSLVALRAIKRPLERRSGSWSPRCIASRARLRVAAARHIVRLTFASPPLESPSHEMGE
jgi:hypothetical protein